MSRSELTSTSRLRCATAHARRQACGSELDFTERAFILGDVLLQDIEHRLGLLRADVDALKIVYGHVVRRRLADAAEQQKKSPTGSPVPGHCWRSSRGIRATESIEFLGGAGVIVLFSVALVLREGDLRILTNVSEPSARRCVRWIEGNSS